MKRKKVFRLLAGALCAAMVVQNVSFASLASGTTPEIAVTEAAETVETVQAPEAEVGQQEQEAAEQTAAENETQPDKVSVQADSAWEAGTVNVVSPEFSGWRFKADNIKYTPKATDVTYVAFHVYGYDANGTQCMEYTQGSYVDDGTWTMYGWMQEPLTDQVTSIRVAAEENNAGSGRTAWSETIARPAERPSVTFTLANQSVGTGTLKAELTWKGDMRCDWENLQAQLYGSQKGSSDVALLSEVGMSMDGTERETSVLFQNLAGGTTYTNAYLRIYLKNSVDQIAYEAKVSLSDFTTSEDKTVDLNTAMPDETFRSMMIEELRNRNYGVDFSDGTAKQSQLEKITSLYKSRSKASDPTIKSIEGIQYLTNLTSVSLDNHEISDLSPITGLTKLTYLGLTGNEIAKAVDLSKLVKLESAYFGENLLTGEEYTKLVSTLPASCYIPSDDGSTQRVGGLQMLVEPKYYQKADGTVPVYVKLTGYKSGLAGTYTFTFTINGTEYTSDSYREMHTNRGVYCIDVPNLRAGLEYSVSAKIDRGSEGVTEFPEKKFLVACEELFMEEDQAYISSKMGLNTYVTVLDSVTDRSISYAELVGSDGQVYGVGDKNSSGDLTYQDPRLTTVGNEFGLYDDKGIRLRSYTFEMKPVYYQTPEGSYDLKLYFTDASETPVVLKNAVYVAGSQETCIYQAELGSNYDNTGAYWYLYLEGANIHPEKLTYTMADNNGIDCPVSYVNYKKTGRGVVIKLKKEWTGRRSTMISVRLENTEGEIIGNQDFTVFVSGGIYYCEWNNATKKLELGIAEELQVVSVSLELKKSYAEDAESLGIYGEGFVKDGFASITLKNEDGSVCTELPQGSLYVRITVNGEEYNEYLYVDGTNENKRDRWSGTSTLPQGKKGNMSYYSAETYSNDTKNTANYKLKIGSTALKVDKLNVWNDNGYASISMQGVDLSGCAAGVQTVALYYKNQLLSAKNVEILDNTKFILDHVSVTREGNDGRVYVGSPYETDSDNLVFEFRDLSGNLIETKQTGHQSYTSSGYHFFSGLGKYDSVWVKISHKTMGEAFRKNGKSYYSDEKGELAWLYESGIYLFTNKEGKAIGMELDSAALPVTVSVYYPYDTERLAGELTVNKGDVDANGDYYFKSSFINSLPNPNGYYELVMVDADGRVSVDRKNLAYEARNDQPGKPDKPETPPAEYKPVVVGTKFTVNQYLIEGVEVPVYAVNDNPVSAVSLTDKAGNEVSGVEAVWEDGRLTMHVTETFAKNQNKAVVLHVETAEGSYTYPLTIAVDTKKPTVKAAQTVKANLFYTDAEAVFRLTSAAKIAAVADVTEGGAAGEPVMALESFDAASNTIIFKAEHLTADTLSTFKNAKSTAINRSIKVSFEGYTDEASVILKVKTGCVVTAPKYTVPEIQFTTEMARKSATIMDAKGKTAVSAEELEGTVIDSVNGVAFAKLTDENDNVVLDLTPQTSKTAKYTLVLTNPNWTGSVKVSSKLTAVAQPQLQLENATLQLNTKLADVYDGTVANSRVWLNKNSSPVGAVSFQGKNAAAETARTQGLKLEFDRDTQTVKATLEEGYTVKPGAYTYILKATVGDNSGVQTKDQKLTVKVVNGDKAKVSASMSAKGSINLLDRANTSIVYKPTFKNMTAKVTGVSLSAADQKLFTATTENGQITLKALPGVAMNVKQQYAVTLKLDLDNGYKDYAVDVKVKPICKYPKLTASLTKGTLYKGTDSQLITRLTTSGTVPAGITGVTLEQDKAGVYQNFDFTYENGTVVISLKNRGADLKAGKTYKLTLLVTLEDDAANAAPKKVTISVTVK